MARCMTPLIGHVVRMIGGQCHPTTWVMIGCAGYGVRFLERSDVRRGEGQPFSGTPQQIVEDIRCCQEIGIAELRLSTVGADITAVTQTWERFAHEVRPKV